jgi:hypothetical protein
MPALSRPAIDPVSLSHGADITAATGSKKRVQVAFDPSSSANRAKIKGKKTVGKAAAGFEVARSGRKRKPKKIYDPTDGENAEIEEVIRIQTKAAKAKRKPKKVYDPADGENADTEEVIYSQAKVVKPKRKYEKKFATTTPKAGTKRKRVVLSPGISPRNVSDAPTTRIGMVEMKGNQVDTSKVATDSMVVPLRQAQTVGRRISIWWPLDEVWYKGLVQKVEVREGLLKHYVFYDDDQGEWINLAIERVKWDPEQQEQQQRKLATNGRQHARGMSMGRKNNELANMKQQLQRMAGAVSLRTTKPAPMASLTPKSSSMSLSVLLAPVVEESPTKRAKAELNAILGRLPPKAMMSIINERAPEYSEHHQPTKVSSAKGGIDLSALDSSTIAHVHQLCVKVAN